MRAIKIGFPLCLLLIASIALPSAAATQHSSRAAKTHSVKAHSRSTHSHGRRAHKKNVRGGWKRHGQQQIASDRVREIQTALIREHYLDGAPNGVWDQRTKNALVKLQASQGWQTKVLPDSRALIKLGLGPNHEGALNLQAESNKNSALLKSSDSLPGTPQQ